MRERILLVGGGGHCHSVLDSILVARQYDRIGILAKDRENYEELKKDSLIVQYLVGTDVELDELFSCGWNSAFVTLGSIGKPDGRISLYKKLVEIGFHIATVVDNTATVSVFSKVNEGSFVGKKAIINARSLVKKCAIVNTGAIIEHDCEIGEFVHVSSGAVICGNVVIGENSHIGAGSVVRQGITIGNNVLIGAGSVVVSSIPDNVKAYGNPCRVVS